MFGVHLPLSDKLRARLFRLIWIAYPALFVPMMLLHMSFYVSGSPMPDPATNRVYAVQEHGTLYVVPWQGELAMSLFWSCILLFTAAFLINPHGGRLFLRRDED